MRRIIASLGLYLAFLGTVTIATPQLELFSPKLDYKSEKELVLFKGRITDAEQLSINGHPIELYNNRFYLKAELAPHQVNEFVVRAENKQGEYVEIKRAIDYFPEFSERKKQDLEIQEIVFDPKTNQWHITGYADKVKSLSINGKPIPIQNNGRFDYRFYPDHVTTGRNDIVLSGINRYLHFFSQRIGLYQSKSRKKETRKGAHKGVEKSILYSFYKKGWGLIPLTSIQEKMIEQLVESADQSLSVSQIRLLKNQSSIVAAIPYSSDTLEMDVIAYQLMLIFQNTQTELRDFTVIWYNRVPQLLEMVYKMPASSMQAEYWILNDRMTEANELTNRKALEGFKKFRFKAD